MRLAGFEPAIFALSRRRSGPLSYRRAFVRKRAQARHAFFSDSRHRDPGPGFEPGLRGSEPRVLPIRPPRRETDALLASAQSTRRDSNPRLSTCEEDALGQAELLVVYVYLGKRMIFPLVILTAKITSSSVAGTAGFEPATSGSASQRSVQLSYAPVRVAGCQPAGMAFCGVGSKVFVLPKKKSLRGGVPFGGFRVVPCLSLLLTQQRITVKAYLASVGNLVRGAR